MVYSESNLNIKFKQDCKVYKLDNMEAYRKLSHYGMKCVDFLILSKDTAYFIEVKDQRYFFEDEGRQSSSWEYRYKELVQKFVGGVFIAKCMNIDYKNLIFCILVNTTEDRIIAYQETVKSRLTNLTNKCGIKAIIVGRDLAQKHCEVFEYIEYIKST